jgi:hypothetical protein
MTRWLLPALAGVVIFASGARAEDADAQRLRAWYDRLRSQIQEIERKTGVLEGGKDAPAAVPDGTGRSLAAALLDLTNRLQELERRVAALEKGAAPPAAPPAGPTPAKKPEPPPQEKPAPGAEEEKDAPAGGDAAAKDAGSAAERPAYLTDAALVKRIPRPGRHSKVRYLRGSGATRGAIDLPDGRGRSIFGEIPCHPGAEVFLLEGAPIFAISLTIVNDRRFLCQGEEFVHVRAGSRTFLSRAKTEGTVETTELGPRYVETVRFAMGLADLLTLLERGGSVTIGDVTLELVPECLTLLGDLCSCLHPDRVEALIR